jgi:biotin-dependent carboxylase-like uncharacterized protein
MIEVLASGLFTTIQDGGRHGYGHLGVPAAGAVDLFNMRVANRLVGNPDGCATLEMTSAGATLRFDADVHIALAGGMLEAQLDGQPVALYQTLTAKAGMVLSCGRIVSGLRCYLGVTGGIDVPEVLGSRSTDTLSGLGPEVVAVGVRLPVGFSTAGEVGAYLRSPPQYAASARLRILPGPHQDWFAPAALRALREAAFGISSQSDRTGVRLEGASLERVRVDELPSMGMTAGAMQVPSSGQPMILLGNHGATGGYPVIASVIAADLHHLAQLPPGAQVRFEEVSTADALDALARQETRLQRDVVAADASLLAARGMMTLAAKHASLRQAAVTDGNRRIRIRK